MVIGVSTHSIQFALQRSLIVMQREIAVKQVEVQTGKLANPWIGLGEKTQTLISVAADVSTLDSILETNKLAALRLEATQDALNAITGSADTARSMLVARDLSATGRTTTALIAKSSLQSIVSALNTTANGQYIFGGLNTSAPPVNSGNGIPAGNEADAAFLAHFGFSKSDPAATSITAADFSSFMTTELEPLFLGAGWNSAVSSATDTSIQTRIALNDVAETSVTANGTGIRKTLFGLSMAANFLDSAVNAEVAGLITESSIASTLSGASEIVNSQTRVGIVEDRVSKANMRLANQRDILLGLSEDLSSVDPYEASVKLNSLLTQIEISYALTQKIQNMSILKFLG